MKKVAVVLSGCGAYDGTEIHEAVLTLLAIEKNSGSAFFFAPDVEQKMTINHFDNEPEKYSRNALIESARIARGKIADLKDFDAKEFDALIFPGGFGAAQTLCTSAFDAENCTVLDSVRDAINAMYKAKKLLGFICISPTIAARVLGGKGVTLTIGNDAAIASAMEKMGAIHKDCPVDSYVKDPSSAVYSTPAYMLGKSVTEIEKGIGKMVEAMLK